MIINNNKATKAQLNYIESLIRQTRRFDLRPNGQITLLQASYLIKKLLKIVNQNVKSYYNY